MSTECEKEQVMNFLEKARLAADISKRVKEKPESVKGYAGTKIDPSYYVKAKVPKKSSGWDLKAKKQFDKEVDGLV